MGIFYKRSARPCPKCGTIFNIKAGIFADYDYYTCEECGTTIYVKVKRGKVISIIPVSEEALLPAHLTTESPPNESCVENVESHDAWERKDNKWWMKKCGYVPGKEAST